VAAVREVSGRVIAFDRSRGRGIVDIDGHAIVVDAAVVDASHLVPGDEVAVELAEADRVCAVRVIEAAREPIAGTTRGLFTALLDAQNGASRDVVAALVERDDVGACVAAWLERWDRPIRFWEPDNVALVVDARRDDEAITRSLRAAIGSEGPPERTRWVRDRLRVREG
jgi:hypothetical protein